MERRELLMIGRSMYYLEAVITSTTEMEPISNLEPEEAGQAERSTGGMDQMENREPMMIDRFMYCPEVVTTSKMEMGPT